MLHPDAHPADVLDPAQPEPRSDASGARVVLMGMMGAGKSTIGALLAERLGWPYLDNDEAVRRMTGREPAEIRATDGEDALHRSESEALAWVLAGPSPMVVGAAGYIADDPRASELLGDGTTAVWLRATPETLLARIGTGQGRRSEATDLAWITRRATEREPAYRLLADVVIDVDELSPAEVVDALCAALGTALDPAD